MERISKAELALRLSRAINYPVDIQGVNTLLYGWRVHRKFGKKYFKALLNREWLYITEVLDFSDYVGYNLAVFPP